MKNFLSILLNVFLFPLFIHTTQVVINNLEPRLDVYGVIIDAHDGSIQQFEKNGLYYMHAMQYGLCKEPPNYGCDGAGMSSRCGFQMNHNISIWSSPNLTSGSWSYVGNAIDVADRPAGVVFRPHLVYNPITKLYVLFWNYMRWNLPSLYAVAIADTPNGPFRLINPALNVSRGGGGDFDILVDDDGTGYIVYSQNYYMSVEQLTPDFYYSTGKSYMFEEYFVEAPIFMKKNNIYYALFGWCCCYCMQGSGILVHTANNPLGPYTLQADGDLACEPKSNTSKTVLPLTSISGLPTPNQGCEFHNVNTTSIARSQQNYIIKVTNSTGYTTYVWTGDRWQQAPDGIKGHEPQYWVPLNFYEEGTIGKMQWIDEFILDV
ncbi:unnamed protein product [Rotaria magnacalcarata]|uniref:Uncharacterized protein n=3 Tax=Rotaria magnacalcarata TaxID=392030 RepID=A0A815EJ51_9BILA|nr:unnamed protein product [Rotaria magnacalcarata]CAF1312654.1 unnamed protein product [Rotaria magnacalcarata]